MTPATWTFDPAHSSISFSVRHMVFAKVRGRFARWDGELHLDASDLTRSRVDVTIDAASIDTGVADRDAHLRSRDFFDVERFDKLRFRSTGIEPLLDGRYLIHGKLTIRDVTREVTLEAEYAGLAKDPWGNQRAAFTANASLNRKDFGLEWNQALEAGGVLVGDKVNIELDVQAISAAAAAAA